MRVGSDVLRVVQMSSFSFSRFPKISFGQHYWIMRRSKSERCSMKDRRVKESFERFYTVLVTRNAERRDIFRMPDHPK